jgi:hypothetical protein
MALNIMLPLEKFNTNKLKIDSIKKLKCVQANVQRYICSILYKDELFTLSPFSILTPFAKIHTWDFVTGKLELHIGSQSIFQTKFNSFQTSIHSLIDNEYTSKPYFHPMLFGNILTVYLYTKMEKFKDRETWIYNKEWTTTLNESSFTKGDSIRLAIQFQGVCFLNDLSKHEIKYRLQHQIKAIYQKSV